MTNTGYNYLIEQIKFMKVTPPDGLTIDQLQGWIIGYGECFKNVIELIESFIDHTR